MELEKTRLLLETEKLKKEAEEADQTPERKIGLLYPEQGPRVYGKN